MIIGIDISSIPYGTGVSNYTLNLVRSLIKIDKKNQYKLFFSSFRHSVPSEITKLAKNSNVKIFHYRLPPTILEILWNRLHLLPIEFFIGKSDIFHTWDWTQPPSIYAKMITTIHDFVPVLFPESQHPKTIANFKRKLQLATKECEHFICVSQHTKSDLLKLYPEIKAEKVTVVYEAAEDKYDLFQKLSTGQKHQKKMVIDKQYGLEKFILAQGTREPRKNLSKLVEGFKLFKQNNPKSPISLAIAGKYGWGKDLNTPTDNSIKILGYIPEKDMVALHASAICLCYVSLYEGFGLPIIKSQKVGTPVITSNTSCLPEIAGPGAILVDPHSASEIANAIEKIVKNDSLRQSLIKKGIAQSSHFSWTKTAAETLKIYQHIFNRKLTVKNN